MPAFQQLQQSLTEHIRNPATAPQPEDVEPRRINIYRELFFNNIEGFISGAFPILRSLYSSDNWLALVRDFMIHHQCSTPYFLEISQEFLLYLQQSRQPQNGDPAFMLELAHYEWAELALDVAEDDLDKLMINAEGDLLQGLPVVSPLVWSLQYQFPVHLIGEGFQPESPPEETTFLLVYRDRQDVVGFMESNAVTARLLAILKEKLQPSGREALLMLSEELQHPEPQQLVQSGLDILQQLQVRDIVLGTEN
jgi:hypothetical protein